MLEGIGTALANKASRPWWAELKALYLSASNETVRDRLAAVLSQCATKAHFDELVTFLRTDDLGETRIYLLRPVNRIGNRMTPDAGRQVVASYVNDALLGKEACAILAGRGPKD